MNRLTKIIFITLAVLIVLCLSFNAFFSFDFYNMDSVKFQNLDNIQLSAKYRQSENHKRVIIVPDLEHDKSEYSSLVYELAQLGYGIYIYDQPSQGGSGGTIPYYSNSSNYFAEQFYCAIVAYSQLEGVNIENISVIAYGTGARAVLQTVSMGYISPSCVTLIGCDINLSGKLQYNILNYSVDKELPWVKTLSDAQINFPVNLIYSTIDEISAAGDNEALLEILESNASFHNSAYINPVKLVPHYLLAGSYAATSAAVSFLAQRDGLDYTPRGYLYFRMLAVLLSYMFFSAMLIIYGKYLYKKKTSPKNAAASMPVKYISSKLLLWLPTIVVICVIPLFLYSIPIPFPYNDIFRLFIVASYGIAMLCMYKFTTFGNDLGKKFFVKETNRNFRAGIIVFLVILTFLILTSVSGMKSIFSFRSNWLWIILYSLFLWPIFYVDEKERKLTVSSDKDDIMIKVVNFISPAVSLTVFLLLGMFNSALMSLLTVFGIIFIFSFEKILFALRSPTALNSLIKAFIFQLLIFSQSPIFNAK